jgi:cytoskeletal protein CcmA (bactofilin family)
MLRKPRTIQNTHEQSLSPSPGEETTIIGERISIEGNIQGEGDLTIDGSVKGTIGLDRHHLTVGSKGRVDADIHAENVTISGTMTGNIVAGSKVELAKDADFNGEIRAKRISVEDGAYLKAVIELQREDQEQPVSEVKPAEQGTSASEKEFLHPVDEDDNGE